MSRCGFDIIELPCEFITIPVDDWICVIEKVQQVGLKAKPEVGIRFGARGTTKDGELEAEGTRDLQWCIKLAGTF
jgi:phosphosulfolactate synthase (CoM biosynthesis protein A)